mmetsp:Transcript_1069/g.3546  ORF Transcript_1069/g.3546 Transcript_1069/m.3546 type:complete len:205 (+) Transcript_1069:118-732(+)
MVPRTTAVTSGISRTAARRPLRWSTSSTWIVYWNAAWPRGTRVSDMTSTMFTAETARDTSKSMRVRSRQKTTMDDWKPTISPSAPRTARSRAKARDTADASSSFIASAAPSTKRAPGRWSSRRSASQSQSLRCTVPRAAWRYAAPKTASPGTGMHREQSVQFDGATAVCSTTMGISAARSTGGAKETMSPLRSSYSASSRWPLT